MAFHSVGPISFEGVSNVTATNSVELGTRRIENGEEYVYCYNSTGSAATQGALMTIVSGSSGPYSMSRTSTASADMPMVAVKHADVSSAYYFWGLVRGKVNALSLALTIGDMITVGTDGAVKTALVGSFPTGPIIGKGLETSTAAAKPLCYVRLWG